MEFFDKAKVSRVFRKFLEENRDKIFTTVFCMELHDRTAYLLKEDPNEFVFFENELIIVEE
nr:MAG TPA: hypothetical protein [Caudoviricetes sp.]DAT69748.1 MAG TPA: hypothetical protein [Caudoviricetes sp.]